MNLDSESEEILKDLRIQGEESEDTSQRLRQMKNLEGQVASLKHENSTVCVKKRQLEEQVECKFDEALQMKERISILEAQVLETEANSKENECQFVSLRNQYEDKEQKYLSRISDLVEQANDMQLELNTLKHQRGELEENLAGETKQCSSQVEGLIEKLNSLQQELVSVNSQKAELETKLKKRIEDTAEENEGLKVMVNNLELEIDSLSRKKSDLEEELKKKALAAFQSNAEKEKLHGKISELQRALSDRENELSTEKKNLKSCQYNMSMKIGEIKNLKNKLEALQMEVEKEKQESSSRELWLKKKNTELTDKIAHQQKTLFELEAIISKLKDENEQAQNRLLYSRQLVDKKVDEVAEEFRKQFEDKYRILSRRIRVAEQLHAENKEFFRKAKEAYEQEIKDIKEREGRTEIGLKHVKELTLTANDVLTSLDTVALKFEECSANFMNRISKASCELKFTKHRAMRKNKALLHVRDDLDCLLVQLGNKEAEILMFRKKLWKTENKVRELEKMLKEKEDGMLGLKEEKREAIRQLCVWIDYHRGQSDYYQKMLSETNRGRRRPS